MIKASPRYIVIICCFDDNGDEIVDRQKFVSAHSSKWAAVVRAWWAGWFVFGNRQVVIGSLVTI